MSSPVLTIDVSNVVTKASLPEDYMQYHYTFHKDLVRMLRPDLRRGIDVIFLYQEKNIRSFCKKIDRFWHNFRKTVDKQTYRRVRDRTMQHMIPNYESSLPLIEFYEEGRKNPTLSWDLKKVDEL